jgi:competence protein ComFC
VAGCPTCRKAGLSIPCQDCLLWHKIYPTYNFQHEAFFQYDDAFHQWIHQYKFLGDYRLRKTFVVELRHFFKKEKFDVICAIPLSKERYLKRGFNQVEGILEAAAIKIEKLLDKKVNTVPQAEKNRSERLITPQPFEVVATEQQITGKRILLVDDVYTTGRTLFHAAEALNAYHPREIRTLSLAR